MYNIPRHDTKINNEQGWKWEKWFGADQEIVSMAYRTIPSHFQP